MIMNTMTQGKKHRSFKMILWIPPAFGSAVLCVLVISLAGCRTVKPTIEIEKSIHDTDDLALNMEQVRLVARALLGPLNGTIAAGADRIKAGTEDRALQREALLFKIDATAVLRATLFRPNPYAAIMDTWVLIRQMTDYFEKGRGRDRMGDAAFIALATCQELESQIEAAVASLTYSGDVSDVREFAIKWAAEHPIRHAISSRSSTLGRVTKFDIPETFSTMDVLGNVVVTLDDMVRRLDIYSAQLLDESRWQAELFALEIGEELQLDRALPLAENAVQTAEEAMAAADRLLPSVERALAVLEAAPEMIARERAAAILALQEELTRTIQFVQQERIATLSHLTEERLAVLIDLEKTIMNERTALTADMEKLSRDVVDHTFLRFAQLTAAVLILLFIGVFVLILLTRRIFGDR